MIEWRWQRNRRVCLLALAPSWWAVAGPYKRLNGPFAWHSKASSRAQSCWSDSTPICTADVPFWNLDGKSLESKKKLAIDSCRLPFLSCIPFPLLVPTEIGTKLPKRSNALRSYIVVGALLNSNVDPDVRWSSAKFWWGLNLNIYFCRWDVKWGDWVQCVNRRLCRGKCVCVLFTRTADSI